MKPSSLSHFYVGLLREFDRNAREHSIIESALAQRLAYTVILGKAGEGKTRAVKTAFDRLKPAFANNAFWLSPRFGPLAHQLEAVRPTLAGPALLVIDDTDDEIDAVRQFLREFKPDPAQTSIVLIGRSLIGIEHWRRSRLLEFLHEKDDWPWTEFPPERYEEFAAAREIAEQRRLGERRPGLLGPDGRPLSADSSKGQILVATAREADRRLLARIRENPDMVFDVSPRRFEELVARIYEDLGYEVKLTPTSNDGGADLHVAKSGPHGSFLFFVECKRYSRDRPVGVALARQLFGVVSTAQASAGVLVTTSSFTKGAIAYQESIPHRLSLRAYTELQDWLDQSGFTAAL